MTKKMSDVEDIELFKCFICRQYKPIKQANLMIIKGLLLPKDVCTGCRQKAFEEPSVITSFENKEEKKK
jgi:hypothetical protein